MAYNQGKNIPNPIQWPKLIVELNAPTIGLHTLNYKGSQGHSPLSGL